MESKVTSFRLPLDTFKQLDKLLPVINERQASLAKEAGLKFVKFSRADLIAHLVDREFYVYFDSLEE